MPDFVLREIKQSIALHDILFEILQAPTSIREDFGFLALGNLKGADARKQIDTRSICPHVPSALSGTGSFIDNGLAVLLWVSQVKLDVLDTLVHLRADVLYSFRVRTKF